MPLASDPSQAFRNALDTTTNNIGSLKGLNSSFSGINNIGDVRRTFGITDASGTFDPMKKALSASRGQALNQSVRSAGRSATPGMSNTGVDSSYAQALQQLLGQQGQANLGQQQFGANLLDRSFGAQDQFGLNKANAITGAAGQLGNLGMEGRKFDASQEGPTFLDFLASTLGSAAGGLAGPAGMALGKSLFGGGGGQQPAQWNGGTKAPFTPYNPQSAFHL